MNINQNQTEKTQYHMQWILTIYAINYKKRIKYQ